MVEMAIRICQKHSTFRQDLITWQAMKGHDIFEGIVERSMQCMDEHYLSNK